MSDMSVTGRPHSSTSTIKVETIDEGAIGTRYSAIVKRSMHLNRPYGDEARHQRKRVSWWNITAQETRAEGIAALEAHLTRELTLTEWRTLQVDQVNFADGISTAVIVWVD